MGRCGRLHAGAGAARNGVHADVALKQSGFRQRQQSELNAGGEATGVGDVLRAANQVAVQLRQAIDIVIVLSGKAEVLGEVNDADVGGNVVFGKELSAFAVTKAEEDHIHVLKGEFVGEAQVSLSVESFVDIGEQVARVAFAVDENDFCFGMIQEKAAEFAGSVAGAADDSDSNHISQ